MALESEKHGLTTGLLGVWGVCLQDVGTPGVDRPGWAQPVEASGSILGLCSTLQWQAREACEEGTHRAISRGPRRRRVSGADRAEPGFSSFLVRVTGSTCNWCTMYRAS